MRRLEVLEFIKTNPGWEKILSAAPYFLIVSRASWNGRRLVMLKYNQFESSFAEPMVKESRGLVFDEDTLEPVSVPFFKFMNYGEPYADQIDWSKSPYVLDKKDGSLIKIVKLDGRLLVSTNGTILASSAPVADQVGCPARNYEELVWHTLSRQLGDEPEKHLADLLGENRTYMFELCTPYNRVVVPAEDFRMWFIGVRDNITLEETFILDDPLSSVFPTPALHDFSSFDSCVATAKALPWTDEGYVVTSRDFMRVKVKSLAYLSCHALAGNGVMTYERALTLMRMNETSEVLSYFPEFKQVFDGLERGVSAFIDELGREWDDFVSSGLVVRPRRDQAEWIKKNFAHPGAGFAVLDGKYPGFREWFDALPVSKAAEIAKDFS